MVERIAYKGLMGDQVKALSNDEFNRMIKSRARRALKRNSLNYRTLNEKIEEYRKKGIDKPIKTHLREAVIVPQWIGLKFKIHMGKEFQEIAIAPNMVGRRLGEFVYTSKRVQHSAPGIRATRGSKFLSVK
ncbi:MAG: ribosomal protein S19 family protein [Candidatus Micrarchaeaceae archaeon]|nr:ribosomal protein S19 family protein [Candidatus Marsarchaeota archaeon]